MSTAYGTARAQATNPTQAINRLKTVVASDLWAGWEPDPSDHPDVTETHTYVSGDPANFEASIRMRLVNAWPDRPTPPRPDTGKPG